LIKTIRPAATQPRVSARFASSFRQKKQVLEQSKLHPVEPDMQQFLNRFLNRKISTKRIDDMPSHQAVIALDNRVNRIMALHATQPVPQRMQFQILSNPFQNQPIS
jgi:hypothetical protein